MSYGEKINIIDIDYTWSLKNYIRAFDGVYIITLFKSIIISSITTLVCLLIAIPVAFYISFSSIRMKSILLVSIMLPLWTNLLIRTYSLIAILRTKGHINSSLEYLWESTNNLLNFFNLANYEIMGKNRTIYRNHCISTITFSEDMDIDLCKFIKGYSMLYSM